MIIERKIYKKIEWYLYNYSAVKAEVEEEERDIIEAADYSMDQSGIYGGGISDKTGNTVAKLDNEKREWISVIDLTLKKFDKTALGLLIAQKYVEKQPIRRICDNLYIGEATYYRWANEIVTYAAFKAVEKNLIRV